jgi:phenylacetic acid degradation operon negative regulatory protein
MSDDILATKPTPKRLILSPLSALGMEPAAVMMHVDVIPGSDSEYIYALWPREHLEAGYREYIALMESSTSRVARLSNPDAARETFLVGEAVIRLINADPLLTSQMIDTRGRQKLIARMVRYHTLGESIWAEFRQRKVTGGD